MNETMATGAGPDQTRHLVNVHTISIHYILFLDIHALYWSGGIL